MEKLKNNFYIPLPAEMFNISKFQIKHPYRWQPRIVSVQVAVIGDLVLAAVPGEFTTMAGRRLKNSLTRVMEQNNQVTGNNSNKVIIAGLSNIYSDYIVTPEEYQVNMKIVVECKI